jgi:hypothetical protein
MIIRSVCLLVLSSLVLSACTWVKASSEGEGVKSLTASQVQNQSCERLGQTHSQTMDKIAFFKRSNRAQKEELEKLAKNEAAKMGGNAVVADTEIVDGRQTYVIYKCQQ